MDQCPYCERKFEKLSDFPKISVVSFKRFQIPEGIEFIDSSNLYVRRPWWCWSPTPRVPEEIADALEKPGSTRVSLRGITYKKARRTDEGHQFYHGAVDVTSDVKTALQHHEVQRVISTLEDSVGQELLTNDLLTLPAFKKGFGSKHRDFSLMWREEKHTENQRSSKLEMNGAISGGSIVVYGISQEMGLLVYEGQLSLSLNQQKSK